MAILTPSAKLIFGAMIRAAERRFNPTSMASGNLLADAHHVEFSNGSGLEVLQ
jgi:hypothetical protein